MSPRSPTCNDLYQRCGQVDGEQCMSSQRGKADLRRGRVEKGDDQNNEFLIEDLSFTANSLLLVVIVLLVVLVVYALYHPKRTQEERYKKEWMEVS